MGTYKYKNKSYKADSGFEAVGACLIVGSVLVGLFMLSAFIFLVAWNAFVPGVFGGPAIDLPAAAGAVLLLSFLGNLLKR
jgi:hypothetical protein